MVGKGGKMRELQGKIGGGRERVGGGYRERLWWGREGVGGGYRER